MLRGIFALVVRKSALRRARFTRDESGSGMVEFAIVTGLVFLPLMFGIIEFGRMMWAKNTVTAAAREGVRYAVVHGTQSGATFDSAAVASYVEGRTRLSPIIVSTSWTGTQETLDTVTVTVKYSYSPVVKLPIFPNKTLTGVSKQIIWY
jgi:Flp pilus assembly protein TadG